MRVNCEVSVERLEESPPCGDAQPKQKSLDFQSFLVSVERLERSTNGLKGHCSTLELHARFCEKHSITRAQLTQALTFHPALVTIHTAIPTRIRSY